MSGVHQSGAGFFFPMTYRKKLIDPRWQKRRLEIFSRDGFKCRCGISNEEMSECGMHLCVHHRYYVSGREPWEYPDWALITLCSQCHDIEHEGPPEWIEERLTVWERALGYFTEGHDGGFDYAHDIGIEFGRCVASGVDAHDLTGDLLAFLESRRLAEK